MLNENKFDSDFEKLRSHHLDGVRAYTTEAVERLKWYREKVLEEQTRRLRTAVAHAQQSSPFYADRR